MKKLLVITKCNQCKHYDDAWWKCLKANLQFEPKDVDDVQIPPNCPLTDAEQQVQPD